MSSTTEAPRRMSSTPEEPRRMSSTTEEPRRMSSTPEETTKAPSNSYNAEEEKEKDSLDTVSMSEVEQAVRNLRKQLGTEGEPL